MDDVRLIHATSAEAGSGEKGEAEKLVESKEEFAKKIDYEILEETLTEDELYNRCLRARQYGVGAVLVRPCDVDSAGRFLSLGVVRVASTVGHPYGSSNSGVKVFECRDLLRRGVKVLHAYPNPGKMLSRQFQHQEVELIQMADACIEAGGVLKVVIDNPLLNDEMVIILCRMAKRVNAHYVVTTAVRDLELVKKHCGDRVMVECGGVRSLEEARMALGMGCVRVVCADVEGLLQEWEAGKKTT